MTTRWKILVTTFVVIYLILNSNLFAQNYWQQTNGPYGGYPTCLAMDSSHTVYLVNAKLYASTNNGTLWQEINLPFNGIRTIAFHPNFSIFAGTWNGEVYRSTNNGQTWDSLSVGILYNDEVGSFFINHQGMIFAATRHGIFRSLNNGQNWQGYMIDNDVICLLEDSYENLYAGTSLDGLWRSTNQGVNWQFNGFSNETIYSIVVDTLENLFLCSESYIYKSTNNGASWFLSNSGIQNCQDTRLFVKSNNYLFGGSDFGVYRSTDNGAFWQEVNSGLNQQQVTQFLELSNSNLLCGSYGKAVNLSTDNGQNWVLNNTGINSSIVQSMAAYPNGCVLAGVNCNGIFYSTNRGINWTASSLQISEFFSWYYAITIDRNGEVYASLNENIYRSLDSGKTWTFLSRPGCDILDIVINPQGHIFLCAFGCHILRSTDHGLNWVDLQGPDAYTQALTIDRNDNLFCGTFLRIYKSTNNGNNWTNIGEYETYSIAVDSAGNIFAGTWEGIYKSTNNGTTWQNIGPINNLISRIVIDYRNRLIALSSEIENAAYMSTNGGLTWSNISYGLASAPCAYVVDSNHYVYCGTVGRSVFVRSDSLISVKKISELFPEKFSLFQNYPNPFNPATSIKFEIPLISNVRIVIYDLLGRQVQELMNQKLVPGAYEVQWNAENFSNGVYFYSLQTDGYSQTKKMVLIK